MNAHIQFGRPKLALELYREMLEHGIDSSSFTLVALLKALSHLKDVDHEREIHSQIYLKGFDGEDSVGSIVMQNAGLFMMLYMYSKVSRYVHHPHGTR
jgi:pentatricopeptide repeat protein